MIQGGIIMRFEVIGPDGKTKMVTWHEECIPYKDQLEELSELGYTFKKKTVKYLKLRYNIKNLKI